MLCTAKIHSHQCQTHYHLQNCLVFYAKRPYRSVSVWSLELIGIFVSEEENVMIKVFKPGVNGKLLTEIALYSSQVI